MNLLEMAWPEVDALDRSTPVVLPIAAMEQHGQHLPLYTDSLLLGEIMRRVQTSAVASQVLSCPLQWLGNSHHHRDMPGTISASPRLYLDLLLDLAENFLYHGFRRIAFVNGHGGNTIPSQQVGFELRQKYRDRSDLLLLALTYWEAADPQQAIIGLTQQQMGHACEWETSMMLALRPELVIGDVLEIVEVPFGSGALPGYRGWTMGDRSAPGHIGNPAAATAEKGEALFELFALGVAEFLERVVILDGTTWEL